MNRILESAAILLYFLSLNSIAKEIWNCGKRPCHRYAECMRRGGSYECQCFPGYQGDGYNCKDINECHVLEHGCHRNAKCMNYNGGITCICDPGYTGDGFVCDDVDECESNDVLNNCHDNATCINLIGDYICECNSGYYGNGIQCIDVDECSENTHLCSAHARCNNTGGGFTCVCDDGYTGDGRNCEEVASVTCLPGSILVEIMSDYFINAGIQLEDLHLNDFSCKGSVSLDSSRFWSFNISSIRSCLTQESVNVTHVTFSNAISNTGIEDQNYDENNFFYPFSCSYKVELDFVLKYPPQPEPRIEIDGGSNTNHVTLTYFTDHSFSQEEKRFSFAESDILYFKAEVLTMKLNLHLAVEECWITSPLNDNVLYYYLIEKGCPVNNSDYIEIFNSGIGTKATFQSKLFSILNTDIIYFNCLLITCSTEKNGSCKPSCTGTEPGKVLSYPGHDVTKQPKGGSPIEVEEKRNILTLGPFTVDRSESSCHVVPYLCHHNANCIGENGVYICKCNSGYHGNGILCVDTDECVENTHSCSAHARCNNTGGGFTCVCDDGYTGDGRSCEEPIKVVCLPDSISIEAISNYFLNSNILAEDLHLNDFSCKVSFSFKHPEIWIFNITSLESCLTEKSINKTHVTYSNALSNSKKASYRESDFHFKISCYYKIIELVTSPSKLDSTDTHFSSNPSINQRDRQGNRIKLIYYNDSSYSMVGAQDVFTDDEDIYFKINIEREGSNLNLVIHKCWVTPTSQSHQQRHRNVISNRCPVKEEFEAQIFSSGVGSNATFKSKLYAFEGSDVTYLHCLIAVCKTEDETTCKQLCDETTIDLKSLIYQVQESLKQEETENIETHLVSAGPFKVSKSNPTIRKSLDSGDELQKISTVLMAAALMLTIATICRAMLFIFADKRRPPWKVWQTKSYSIDTQ